MQIRSFLAFDISDEVKENLTKLIADFSKKEKGIKWIPPENMHVTMKFFGSIDQDQLLGPVSNTIEDIVKKFKATTLACQGIGVFPNWKYPRIVWAGFIGDIDNIIDMQTMIEGGLETYDLHKDEREFRLHLTIGRASGSLKNSPIMELAERLGPIALGLVNVDRLVLYKSMLTKQGAVYTNLKEFLLSK